MPSGPSAKVLLSHRGALTAKYGAAGLSRIRSAARGLAASDKARGLTTRLVFLDDKRTASRLGLSPVADPADARGAKAFVDGVDEAWTPDYLMLLGSVDVVPMQPLTNPLFSRDPRRGDADTVVESDLPYACDAPFSADPGAFRGATRVVGRLPDVTGNRDAAHLERLLQTAAAYRPRRRSAFLPPFALSAHDWRRSSALTLERLVGTTDDLASAPPDGPQWPPKATRRRLHFVNCHGGVADWRFYGERGSSLPVALDATRVRLTAGTVAAAECCYGGLLYDPGEAQGNRSFPDTYLAAGAHAFFGATTIAYGPSDRIDAADLITRFFLAHVLNGCSIGRAALQARQDYVFQKAVLSPVDLKTLAQFALYGDPSVHPVAGTPPVAPKAVAGDLAAKAAAPAGRGARRRRLRSNGRALELTTNRAAAEPTRKPGVSAVSLARVAERPSAADGDVRTYPVLGTDIAPPGDGERFHVVLDAGPTGPVAVVAREEAGRLQGVTVLGAR